MKYHLEYAKYQYGFLTIVGWLVGKEPLTDLSVRGLSREGREIQSKVVFLHREDIQKAFFAGEAGPALYGFRIKYPVKGEEISYLLLQAGSSRVRIKVDPRKVLASGVIADNWKAKIKERWGKKIDPYRRDTDGAIMVYPPEENPYKEALTFGQRREAEGMEETNTEGKAENLLFSVMVPLYQTNREHLLEMLESVFHQLYENWELCLADGSPEAIEKSCQERVKEIRDSSDAWETAEGEICKKILQYLKDPRVKYQHLKENKGISGNTNEALLMAAGDYTVMLDHDDRLHPDALFLAAERIGEKPETDFLYSDSDLTDHDHLYEYNPLYKPDWSPQMLYSANYITHLSIVRTSLLKELGGVSAVYDGAQDWDLFLRIGEKTDRIERLPEILYHWRAAEGSTAVAVEAKPYAREAQKRAVQAHLDRMGIPAKADFSSKESTCIRLYFSPKDPLVQSREDLAQIVTAPGITLTKEAERELQGLASIPGIGIVGVRVLREDGRIRSQGTLLQEKGEKTVLYEGILPHRADALGHTDWYRNDLVPDPRCFAVSREAADKLGLPKLEGSEREKEEAMEAWFYEMKREGYRSVIDPFVEVI